MLLYEMTKETVSSEDMGSYISYGVRTEGYSVGDLSSVREEVEQFIERLNAQELSPLHLHDAVEDWLTEQASA